MPGCAFGPGFYRVLYDDHTPEGVTHRVRYFDEPSHVESFVYLLPPEAGARVKRDGCLDHPLPRSDASTPDVVDGEWWLALSRTEGMAELGLTGEADYRRIYASIQDAVYERDNREKQGGVHASIVIRRRKTRELAPLFVGGTLTRIK